MEHVILLHGLGSHGVTMSLMRQYIIRYSDYNVICPTYQSLFFKSIHKITDEVVEQINSIVGYNDTIHFIGHSLGGIIAKMVCNSARLKALVKIGNIVTLGTPHNGAILANKILKKFPLIEYVSPIVRELSKESSFISKVVTPITNIGVVVGMNKGHIFNPLIYLGNLFLKDIKSHDGVVELESNLHKGIRHLICLDVNHVEMLWSYELFKVSLDFIKYGKF